MSAISRDFAGTIPFESEKFVTGKVCVHFPLPNLFPENYQLHDLIPS